LPPVLNALIVFASTEGEESPTSYLSLPFFRWAKRRGIIRRSPMADFELPTSSHVATEHTPPEVDQLRMYLQAALEVVPDAAPALVLGAVTGMRRGELVGLRRSRLYPNQGKMTVDTASDNRRIKATKTRKVRDVAVDPETMAMLLRHCVSMDERAAACGVNAPTGAPIGNAAFGRLARSGRSPRPM